MSHITNLGTGSASSTPSPASVEAPGGGASFRSWCTAHPSILAGFGLFTIIAASASLNIWWVVHYRRGLPFDIDESGYLLRALEDAAALSNQGLWGFLVHLHSPDPQAPLLPATAGIFKYLTGAGPIGLIAFQQFFFVVLLLSTYWIARRVGGRLQALVATAVVAAVPGVFESSRAFDFGLVALAMLTFALGAQLWAASFDRWIPALTWGVALGLAAVSRTMVLGLLPGLVAALVLRMWAVGFTWRRVGRITTGLAIALLFAWSWYSASWRNVLHYLSSYGYGAQEARYGTLHPVLSTTWWTSRPIRIMQSDLEGPMTVLLIFLVLVSIAVAIVTSRRRRFQQASHRAYIRGDNPARGGRDETAATDSKAVRHDLRMVRSIVARDEFALAFVLVYTYLALSSTANVGSYFELPIIPTLVILLVAGASRTTWSSRFVASVCLAVATMIVVVDSGPWIRTRPVLWGSGSHTIEAFDGRGSLYTYLSMYVERPNRWYSVAQQDHYLEATATVNRRISSLAIGISQRHGRSPVILLATQDPMTNTNSLSLLLYQSLGYLPPVGEVEIPNGSEATFFDQLTLPQFGEPNLVIVGPNSPVRSASAFAILPQPLQLIPALRRAGFSNTTSVTLPDGRVLGIWWKDVGPVLSATSSRS